MEVEDELSIPESISIPICFGTISFPLAKKQQDEFTHKWMAFVRGAKRFDISSIIERVDFVLDESFKDNQRAIHHYPFEIHEKGWGEFDMIIRIHFKAPYNKEPLDLLHHLGLHHPPNTQVSNKKPVISEQYDEVVFVNPTVKFYKAAKACLDFSSNDEKTQQAKKEQEEKQQKNDYYQNFTNFNTEEHQVKLDDALNVVKMELERLQGEMKNKDKELQDLYKQINEYTL